MRTRAKGRRYPIEIACVAWADLLGYGAMLEAARFDPQDPRTKTAIDRLKTFQRTAVKAAHRVFPAMPINDGVAYFTDLSPRTASVTADFLTRAIRAHAEINSIDQSAGYPGARMVIAAGPRVRVGRPKRSESHLASIFRRLGEGVISTTQAIQEAFISGPIAGFVPALQANFAFSRAYLANEAGTRAGLGGPNCYVDLAAFEEPPPQWIRFRRRQVWNDRGLDVSFGELEGADWKMAGRLGFAGVLAGAAIAASLGVNLSRRLANKPLERAGFTGRSAPSR